MTEPPEWLKEQLLEARELLGIGDEWHIVVVASEDLANDKDHDGECTSDSSSLNATIRYASNLSEKAGRELAMHEMLHVLHAEIDQFVTTISEQLQQPSTIMALYDACYERFTHRLARSLAHKIRESPKTIGGVEGEARNGDNA